MNDLEIECFTDKRGYKLQFIAAETGKSDTIKELINRGFDFEDKINGKSSAELAFEKKHYDIVLSLLDANFQYPKNYDDDLAPIELKEFTELTNSVHDCIKNDQVEKLKEILTQNAHLRYFFSTENKSAIRVSIENKKFEIYEILLTHKVFIGPHENTDDVIKTLNRLERRKMRDIHLVLSTSIHTEPMTTFMQNSLFGPDCPDRDEYQNFIYKAYFFLLQIPNIAIIFNIVAATKNFKIIYDFKRETVGYNDPTAEPYTNGLFYVSGKIYIGAKNMTDPNKRYRVYGVIAHELCHFAMFLVYKNQAKPYHKKNINDEREFDQILNECIHEKDCDEIIQLVFDCYPDSMQHAELIVRVPHMLATYHANPEILQEKKELVSKLFNFFDQKNVPDMKKALPHILKKYRPESEKKVERQKKIIILISVLFCLLIVISIPIIWLNFSSYSWISLSSNEKSIIKNAVVNYQGVDVKFQELFPNDSIVYESLTSQQIKNTLEGNGTNLSKAVNSIYDQYIHLRWDSLSVNLNHKLLNSYVDFQGQKLMIKTFLDDKSLKLLSSEQLKLILKAHPLLNISSEINANSKFFIERSFIEEDDKSHVVKHFDDIIIEMENKNIFLLSSRAGEGKSTTLQHLGVKLKKKFPHKWIQLVKLNSKIEALEKIKKVDVNDPNQLINFLTQDLINTSEFDQAVFSELFNKNDVILLWDGIDEIFQTFSNSILDLITAISKGTKNWQLLSTRPQYTNILTEKFSVIPFDLLPLDEIKRTEFLIKYIAINLNMDAEVVYEKYCATNKTQTYTNFSKVEKIIENGDKILHSIETTRNNTRLVTNPLLIRMIAEIANDDELQVDESYNLYSLYSAFITKKMKIARGKGELFSSYLDKITLDTPTQSYLQVHQIYAISLIFGPYIKKNLKNDSKTFEQNIKNKLEKVSITEMSNFGIINVKSIENFDFVHRTFAEFLAAQYLIYELNQLSDMNEKRAKNLLYIFNSVIFSSELTVVRKFLISFSNLNMSQSFPIFKYISENKFIAGNLREIKNLDFDDKFLFFSDLMFFTTNHFNLAKNIIFYKNSWFFPWTADKFISRFLLLILDLTIESLQFLLEVKNEENMNLLFQFVRYTEDLEGSGHLDFLLNLYIAAFGSLKASYFLTDNGQNNIMFEVAWYQNIHAVKFFWSVVEENLNSVQILNLITVTDDLHLTILHYSMNNMDFECFQFFKEIYQKYLSKGEIQKILLKFEENDLSFVYNFLLYDKADVCEKVAYFLLDLFEDNKIILRNFLSHRDQIGETIFSVRGHFSKSWNILKNLLRKTYDDDESFEIDFKTFSRSLINVRSFVDYPFHHIAVSEVRFDHFFLKSTLEDWKLIIDKYGSIHDILDSIKLISDYDETVFHVLLGNVKNEHLLVDFISKIKSSLSNTELVKLVFDEETAFNANALMVAALINKLPAVKNFWNFLNEILTEDQTIKILKGDEVLQYAARNEELEVFKFVTKIYEEKFTRDKIQNIILKNMKRPSIIDHVLSDDFTSSENCEEVVKFLLVIFKDHKNILKQFLEIKDELGMTIFDVYDERVKVFVKLYDDIKM